MKTVHDCRLIDLPRVSARQGSISYVTGEKDIPFNIERIYYLYDVPGGESRGGHAHKELQQVLVSVMGCFDVVIKDGHEKKLFTLNRGYQGLYIPRMIWRELENFSTGGVCLALVSLPYDEDDYHRDYSEFLKAKGK